MVDTHTEMHDLALPPPQRAASSGAASSSCAATLDLDAIARCVLDQWTQRAFYEMLHGPLTSLQHQTALRRHAAVSTCRLSDVLRVSDLGQRVFLMVPMRWRGSFASVCREWWETTRLCWQADDYELVKVHQHVNLRNLGGPVTQVSSWMRASQTKPIFFLLALSEDGRLEQMRISCKKAEPGIRRPDADDDVRVEHSKDWRLEESVPAESAPADRLEAVSSQFVVTKHHAYCVVAVRGQALLVKLGGNSNGTHEHMYTDRFPTRVTTMSMCPLDNNIIAFGVPVASADATATAAAAIAAGLAAGSGSASDASASATQQVMQVIELVNFAQSSRIQTLATQHTLPLLLLDYSPDSEQLLSVSADCVQVWYKELLESRGPGALDDKPERTLKQSKGTAIRLAKVHPAWTSVLLATNEALEVRELRRPAGETIALSSRHMRNEDSDGAMPLALKWRRENMQVTAAAFVAQGNMLVVSDRGDRLLLLNYHGLTAAKRCVLPWASPSAGLPSPRAPQLGAPPPLDHEEDAPADLQAPLGHVANGNGGGNGGGGSSSSRSRSSSAGGGARGVCTVTSIVECPDVVGRCSEEWRSGISQLAVSSSRGDVILIKI